MQPGGGGKLELFDAAGLPLDPSVNPDAAGNPRHWILEIHFVDRERGFGAFCEELLTI